MNTENFDHKANGDNSHLAPNGTVLNLTDKELELSRKSIAAARAALQPTVESVPVADQHANTVKPHQEQLPI